MCVCARACVDESRSQEGEAVFVRSTPLSLSFLGYTCLPDLRSSAPAFSRVPSSVFLLKGDGIHSGHAWGIIWSLTLALYKRRSPSQFCTVDCIVKSPSPILLT